jgi:hypothetical protein
MRFLARENSSHSRRYEGAISAARSIAWSDEEIARATGLFLSMVPVPPRVQASRRGLPIASTGTACKPAH